MARHGTDETLTDEAGWSRGRIEQLRFLVLGGDDDLMDEACATILGERENRHAFKFGELKPRKAQVRGQQVSVLKTPSYWLEHLKSYYIFSNGVNSLKYDLQFFESLLFPGPHAFLLVHRDVKSSGRENYLLQALADVFGEKVLDYCMVLFMDRARHNDPNQNNCLKMCGGRYHILQNTDTSVHQLFDTTKTMTKSKSSSFFINHFEYLKNVENYFKAEHEEKQNKLSRELVNSTNAENLKKEMLSKDRENQLHNDLDALKSRENQMKEDFQKLKEELIIYKNRVNELSNELNALKSNKNQTKEDFQKLKEELIIYKDRENLLLSELDALKSRENQMKEDFRKLKGELIIYRERERHLKDDKEKLQTDKEKVQREQLKDNGKTTTK